MKTVFLQCKRGLKSPALLNAFINLGVEREWLEKELQKICSSAHIETGNESSYIIIDAEEEKRLSQNKILGKLEECLFDEEIRNSIKKVLSLMANSGYNQKETRDSGTVAAYEPVAAALYAVSFILCIKALNCKAVYNSPLELNLASDIRLLDILKGTEVKLVRDSACEVDCCAAAFIAAIGQSKDALEGRVLEVSKGEEKGSEINVILFECEDKYEKDIQYIVECNIDDMNSEGYDYIFNKLLSAGALDVYITPIIMKKGRPAVKLSVLTSSERLNEVKEHIFRETSTFGVRSYQVEKSMLERSFGKIDVCGETVRIKYGYFNGKTIKCKPEYEDCRRIAQKEGLGINRVYTEALRNMPPII